MAQAVERRLGKAEVTGSSPVSSFRFRGWDRVPSLFFVILLSIFLTNSNVTKMLQAILVQMLQKSREKNEDVGG